MARNRTPQTFEKRARERDKQAKREAKQAERLARNAARRQAKTEDALRPEAPRALYGAHRPLGTNGSQVAQEPMTPEEFQVLQGLDAPVQPNQPKQPKGRPARPPRPADAPRAPDASGARVAAEPDPAERRNAPVPAAPTGSADQAGPDAPAKEGKP